MKTLPQTVATVIVALALVVAIAPQTGAQTPTPQAEMAQTPAEFDKQVAKMHEHMTKMQEQMLKIQQTQDPQERQRLLKEHWSSMQGMMTMMHEAGGGMMGCCGADGSKMGGHMKGGTMSGMGGPMMNWDNYQKLTPEQLKQRQYMMDSMMPMQQMMMSNMMQHMMMEHSMMQSPSPRPTPPTK